MEEGLKLREANEGEIPTLTQQARKYLPQSLTVHGLLSIGFTTGASSLIGSKIFVPRDENFPFFIVFTNVVDMAPRQTVNLFWNPAEVSTVQAKQLLESLPEWDWKQPVFFNACSALVLRELQFIIPGKEGLSDGETQLSLANEGFAYTITSVESGNYALSEEFVFAPIPEALAPTVHFNWQFNTFESVEGIRKIIVTLPTMCIFARKTNAFGRQLESKPVSWLMLKANGELGFTYTIPSHRRRGLAGAATSKLSENLLKENMTPYVLINNQNIASIKFHEKIGFRKILAASFGWFLYKTKEMKITDF